MQRRKFEWQANQRKFALVRVDHPHPGHAGSTQIVTAGASFVCPSPLAHHWQVRLDLSAKSIVPANPPRTQGIAALFTLL